MMFARNFSIVRSENSLICHMASFSHPSGIEQQTVKRPNAMHLGVDEKNSFIFVCDERNYVTKINFGKYIEDFPENITMATHIDGALKDRRTPKTFGNVEFEQCSYDDPFWEMELSRIALEYENGRGYH